MPTNSEFYNQGIEPLQKTRLRCLDKSVFSDASGFLAPLRNDAGVVFPYSPFIQVAHSANYGTFDITHSNYQPQYYVNSPNPTISLTANFTAQDQHEAEYAAAALHFFKSMTKMDYGLQNRGSGTAGMPPPVLTFSAYGSLHFRNVPVVLRNFGYSLIDDADYVTFRYCGEDISIPTQFVCQIDLAVQMTPTRATNSFNLQDYYSGSLLKKGFL